MTCTDITILRHLWADLRPELDQLLPGLAGRGPVEDVRLEDGLAGVLGHTHHHDGQQ